MPTWCTGATLGRHMQGLNNEMRTCKSAVGQTPCIVLRLCSNSSLRRFVRN